MILLTFVVDNVTHFNFHMNWHQFTLRYGQYNNECIMLFLRTLSCFYGKGARQIL